MQEPVYNQPPSCEEPLELCVGLAGRYKIEVTKPDGRVEVLADWFENLITDQGLNRWGTGDIVKFCSVGTGTNQPTNGDTSLQALLATTATNSYTTPSVVPTGGAPYSHLVARVFSFAQGAVVGNISEVGVGWLAAAGNLFSHARIKDGGGVDTTITIASIDQLNITYQLKINVPDTDVTGNITISAVSTNTVVRPASITGAGWTNVIPGNASPFDNSFNGSSSNGDTACTAYAGPLGAVTGTPSGTAFNASTGVAGVYGNNNLYNDRTFTLSTAQGNVPGGIGAIYVDAGLGQWQMSFSPLVAKDNTKTFSFVFRTSWART